MMSFATRTLCECQPSGTSMRASSLGLLRVGHVDDGRAARSGACGRHRASCLRPRPDRRRDNRCARRAWCWTAHGKRVTLLAQTTLPAPARRPDLERISRVRTSRPTLVAAPLLVEVELLQRRLVARDEQEHRILGRRVDMLEPGAARDGERVELRSSRSAGRRRSNGPGPRTARPAGSTVWRTGRVRSPGRSICTKNVMVLNTGPPVVGSIYSTVRASCGSPSQSLMPLEQFAHHVPAIDEHRRRGAGAALRLPAKRGSKPP